MSPRSFIPCLLVIAAAATAAALVQEPGPAEFDLSWNTIDGGGGQSTGSDFEVSGTIGQPDAGLVMTGGAGEGKYSLTGGFWPGAASAPAASCPPDIAGGDGVVNVDDLLAV